MQLDTEYRDKMVSTSQYHFYQRHFSCYAKSLFSISVKMDGKNEWNKNDFFLALQWFRVAFFHILIYIREIISTAVSRNCVWRLVNDERNCTHTHAHTQYSANISKYRHFLMVNNTTLHEYEWNIKSKTFKISYSRESWTVCIYDFIISS